jgi:hypothetical protein
MKTTKKKTITNAGLKAECHLLFKKPVFAMPLFPVILNVAREKTHNLRFWLARSEGPR